MSVSRFWRKIPQRYNLIGTQCTTCGATSSAASTMPECRAPADQTMFSGGTVVTYALSGRQATSSATPYVLAIIKLDEGPRLTAQVVCPPEEARIGMRVRGVFRRVAADGESGVIHYGTKFVPVEGEDRLL